MPKVTTRVRTGCWTCKRRHRKCDEAKPACNNCTSTGRVCEGYSMRLMFSTDAWTNKGMPQKKKPRKQESQPIAPKPEQAPSQPQNTGVQSRPSSAPVPNIPASNHGTALVHSASVSTAPIPSSVNLPTSVPSSNEVSSTVPTSVAQEWTKNRDHKNDIDYLLAATQQQDLPGKAATSPLSQAIGEMFTQPEDGPRSPLSQMFGEIFSVPLADLESGSTESKPFDPDSGIMKLIGRSTVFDGSAEKPPLTSLNMTYQEENMMLKHFFQKLLPLLDAHPQSPWPVLALQYCDFDVARSCFISLACIHIYESREGGNEFYAKGIAHIHSTMNHLIQFISNATSPGPGEVEDEADKTKMHLQSFVILVLVNVHILFAVVEKGQSSLARYLFKVFGSICQDKDFYQTLMETESKGSLVVVISWYDTVSAMVSPDCRLPYCSPDWYGSCKDIISTSKMMGCPGEIFKALSEVCFLRHEIYNEIRTPDAIYKTDFERVKFQLLSYRDYVTFEEGTDYILRLQGAQCWSLAVYVSLLRLFDTEETKQAIQCAVHEFINIYGAMPSDSPLVTQMVWPTYAIGCECKTDYERDKLYSYITTLYESAQMGTLASLRWVVEQVWKRGITQEAVLEDWLDSGVDYLPL